jgi:hypothetical protein
MLDVSREQLLKTRIRLRQLAFPAIRSSIWLLMLRCFRRMRFSPSIIMAILFLLSGCGYPHRDNLTDLTLPSFSATDLAGRLVSSRSLNGKSVYVQFVRKIRQTDLSAIMRFYDEGSYSSLIATLFVYTDTNIQPALLPQCGNLFYLSDESAKFRKAFRAPECCDSFMIFNRAHRLMAQGIIDYDMISEVIPLLKEMAEDKELYYFDAQFKRSKLKSSGILPLLRTDVEEHWSGMHYCVVVLLNKLCESCSSGGMVEQINRYYESKPGIVSFVLLVPGDFSEIDIDNLRATLGITMPTKRVAAITEDRWGKLKSSFPKHFDNLFLILDDTGGLIDVADEIDTRSFLSRLGKVCQGLAN